MKIAKIKEVITSEIANSFNHSIAIDTEATGLQIQKETNWVWFKFVMKKEMFLLFN